MPTLPRDRPKLRISVERMSAHCAVSIAGQGLAFTLRGRPDSVSALAALLASISAPDTEPDATLTAHLELENL